MSNLSASERKVLLEELNDKVMTGQLSIGETIKAIRINLYGMTQTQYAAFINISDKTLRDIEKGHTDPRLSILNKLLKPGGFEVGVRQVQRHL